MKGSGDPALVMPLGRVLFVLFVLGMFLLRRMVVVWQ
jgi:hypothetical protein